jgi:hypothetical protein
MKDKNKNKRKDENTGSEAHNGPGGLHFLQDFRTSRDIRQGNIQTSFYTNTFNQIPSFCQGFNFNLSGVYRRIGNTIKLSSSLILKIQERKHETRNKPKEYLSLYTTKNRKLQHVCYISSLFKVEGKENTYWFDYWFEGEKVYYTLRLTDTTAIINDFLPLPTIRGKK